MKIHFKKQVLILKIGVCDSDFLNYLNASS